jgi:hypothetical protein
MKAKILAISVMSILMVSGIVGFAIAGKHGGAGNSNTAHLYLYEKDPNTWEIVEDGAWGKMTYDCDSFVFNGHGLDAREDYTLIYYPDLNNKYQLDFVCTSGCSGTYTHTMLISTFDETGFSGNGYYNANNAYTWDVTGTSIDTFTLVYTGINAGYTVTCTDGSCSSSSGQTFDLTVTDIGSAIWPHPIEVLGTGTTNGGGNVHIMGGYDFTSIPWSVDTNSPGAKIWLVKSAAIVGTEISGWNPTEYLFEHNLI